MPGTEQVGSEAGGWGDGGGWWVSRMTTMFCSSSHQKVRSISPLLESGTLWPAFKNRKWGWELSNIQMLLSTVVGNVEMWI